MSNCPNCKGPMCNIAFMGPANMVCAAGDDCATVLPLPALREYADVVMDIDALKAAAFASAGISRLSQPIPPSPTSKQSAQPGATRLHSPAVLRLAARQEIALDQAAAYQHITREEHDAALDQIDRDGCLPGKAMSFPSGWTVSWA